MSVFVSLDEISIRPLTGADIQPVRQLHSHVLPIRYPQSFFLQLLLLPARICLVAHPRSDPHNLIGFISAVHSPDPPSDARIPRIEILTLGVIPSYQHRGLARRLIRSIAQHLCTFTSSSVLFQANVATSNTPALKFYKQLGFQIASEVITNLYRTCNCSSRDGYLVVGFMPVQSSSHRIPLFYACYLLKSIQSSKSKATYIGSTPNPPRRIRQHNGEISQGAWKTRHKRPWVMQMIVYGFPSKLAALQFEWAWQHPHLSRHLRDQDGKPLFADNRQLKLLKWCINTVHIMICHHPYNTWPLHVKLFTTEAVKYWEEAGKRSPLLLPGFTYQIELEGPVPSVQEERAQLMSLTFTNTVLAKHGALATSGLHLCSLCNKHLGKYIADPTATVLCPNQSCLAVSHTLCLSEYFLSSEQNTSSVFIPRGGHCPVCEIYTLWGDIIRGSHRRLEASSPYRAKKNRTPDKNIVVDRIPGRGDIDASKTGEEDDVWSLDEGSDPYLDIENESPGEDFVELSPSQLRPPESTNKRSPDIYPLAIARSRQIQPWVDLPLTHALSGLTLTSDGDETSDAAREPSKVVIELSD